jgi:hypothetical protein
MKRLGARLTFIVILKNKGKEGGEQKLGGSYRNQYTVGQLIV